MESADSDFDCYVCQIFFDERHGNTVSFLSHWEGFFDVEFRIELRAASKTSYMRVRNGWENELAGPLMPVQSELDLWYFWIKGGAAAIEANLAERVIPEKLAAKPVANTGFGPFYSVKDRSIAGQRAPTKKLRMRIIERDHYRCRVCGQSSQVDVNIELHVHHVRPWENRGATTESNLVTLCHTCHSGLDPHWNMKLALFLADLNGDPARWKTPPKPFQG